MKRCAILLMTLVLIVALGLLGTQSDLSASRVCPAAMIAAHPAHGAVLTVLGVPETILVPGAQFAGMMLARQVFRPAGVPGASAVYRPIPNAAARQTMVTWIRD